MAPKIVAPSITPKNASSAAHQHEHHEALGQGDAEHFRATGSVCSEPEKLPPMPAKKAGDHEIHYFIEGYIDSHGFGQIFGKVRCPLSEVRSGTGQRGDRTMIVMSISTRARLVIGPTFRLSANRGASGPGIPYNPLAPPKRTLTRL